MGGCCGRRASKLTPAYAKQSCVDCGNSLKFDAVTCNKCGMDRPWRGSPQVDTNTELDKLLAQAEVALATLSGPCICFRPFKRRRAHRTLSEVLLRLGTVPASNLMRPDIDGKGLEQIGIDRDTSRFLTNLLGLEASQQRQGCYPSEAEASISMSQPNLLHLPNMPASSSSSPPGPWRQGLMAGALRYTFDEVTDWKQFDVFEAAAKLRSRLFVELFLIADSGLDMVAQTGLDLTTLAPALTAAQRSYEEPFQAGTPNSYHTALHGAEVLCAVLSMLNKVTQKGFAAPPALSSFALVVAALFHDLRHPGMQARFLTAVNHEVCFTYLDDSPLERFHLAEIFRLFHAHGCLSVLDDGDRTRFRRLVTGMVLATDLGQGYKNASLVKAAFPHVFSQNQVAGEAPLPGEALDVSTELLNFVVECADVSHPARPLEQHQRWSVLITHEFLLQGDLETERGLPVSPLCLRASTMDAASFARSQQGFIDFVVRPKLTVLSKLCGQDDLWMRLLEENHASWGAQQDGATLRGFIEVSESLKSSAAFERGIACARRPGKHSMGNRGHLAEKVPTPPRESRTSSHDSTGHPAPAAIF